MTLTHTIRFATGSIILALLTSCAQQGPGNLSSSAGGSPAKIKPEGSAEQVKERMRDWVNTVATGSTDKLGSYYDDRAVLVSAFEPVPAYNKKERAALMREVFKEQPSLKVMLEDQRVLVWGDTAISNGELTYGYQKGQRWITVPARFTVTYLHDGKDWMIVDEHISRRGDAK